MCFCSSLKLRNAVTYVDTLKNLFFNIKFVCEQNIKKSTAVVVDLGINKALKMSTTGLIHCQLWMGGVSTLEESAISFVHVALLLINS